jgi:hypothetical protein
MTEDNATPEPDDYLTTRRGQEALAYQVAAFFDREELLKHLVDPAHAAAEILRRELPGFEANIDEGRDMLAIRWLFKLGLEVSRDAIYYAVPSSRISSPFGDVVTHDPRAIEAFVAPIIEQARRAGVDALGLGPVMHEREVSSYHRGYAEGRAAGRDEGRRLGRQEVLAELAAAAAEEGIDLS